LDIVFGALCAVILACIAVLLHARRRRRYFRKLEDSWGKPVPPGDTDSDVLEDIASYWRESSKAEPFGRAVDDTTWSDLDMDAIFRLLDRAESGVGEEVLYAMLREIGADGETLARRSRYIEAIKRHSPQRTRMRAALRRLGKARYHRAWAYLFHPSAKKPAHGAAYAALAGLSVALPLLSFIQVQFLIAVAAAFAANLAVYYWSGRAWMGEIAAIRHIASVLTAATRLKDACPPGMEDARQELTRICREMKPVLRWNALFAMQRQNPFDVITDYLRISLQLDMLCLIRLTAFFEKHNAALRALYRLTGEIDACIAIANFRASGAETCEPEFTGDLCVRAEGLAHPLLKTPVRNDIAWDRCALITGSNASGKSTFTKALAIGAILAQSVCTCTARSFKMPRARVLTSMALRDDVEGGESYFIVEIKSLRRIISALGADTPTLCFIDEILRGTNTVERIAASSAFLGYLERQNCLCMAATHDQELTQMLSQYRQLHFREDLTPEGMTFSYKLLEGPSDTRNAIALIKQMAFPEEILETAAAAVRHCEATGSWRQKGRADAQ